MSREVEHRIEDITRSCERILRYTSGMRQEQLAENDLVLDAVVRNIEIIGEATKHLPDDIRARMGHIDWKKIAGMRDWVSHVYFRVDLDIVWDVIQTKVPELLLALEAFKNEDPVDP